MFGDRISLYDIQRAVKDEAIVPIYCEGCLANLAPNEIERPTIDAGFEGVPQARRSTAARR